MIEEARDGELLLCWSNEEQGGTEKRMYEAMDSALVQSSRDSSPKRS